jgi:hypothetical protein
VVHGGVYCTVVESAASIGASAAVIDRGQFAIGVNNSTDSLRPATAGRPDGLAVDAALLHDGVNVVLHLRPAPVVARIATLTPLLRPAVGRHFGRGVALAGALAAAGAPVVPPSDLLPPAPTSTAC